jgi:hypothetical protein
MDKFQKEKDAEKTDQQQQQQQQQKSYYGGQQQYRGGYRFQQRGGYYSGWNRNRGYQGRGRGTYVPRRPLASNTFMGTCYICNEKGHMARDCTKKPTPNKDLKE